MMWTRARERRGIQDLRAENNTHGGQNAKVLLRSFQKSKNGDGILYQFLFT